MEILLIDIGALALFLGYIALVYWHGTSHDADPATRKVAESDALLRRYGIPPDYLERDSTTARSARSSVEIGQLSSQLLQYASISAPFLMSKISSPREYPGCTRSCPHFGHSEEKRHGSLIS